MGVAAAARTSAAIAARRHTTELSLSRVQHALTRMRGEQAPVTASEIARRASVSRTFLYQNPQARALVAQACGQAAEPAAQVVAGGRAGAAGGTWRERALNAEAGLRAAYEEIRLQREQIALLLGRIRDLDNHLPGDDARRAVSENTTLGQQIHQLTAENKELADRLRSARDNNRFSDKKIADLETALLDHLRASDPRPAEPAGQQ